MSDESKASEGRAVPDWIDERDLIHRDLLGEDEWWELVDILSQRRRTISGEDDEAVAANPEDFETKPKPGEQPGDSGDEPPLGGTPDPTKAG